MNKNKKMDVRKLVGLAFFTAIVVVLQLLGQFIRFGPFSISLVLVPIVVGAAMYGPAAGAYLGGVFGVIVLLQPDTMFFTSYNAAATIVIVMLKGIACGLCAGLIYRLLEAKSRWLAVIVAAIVCPIVNSGIFFLGCLGFFLPLIEETFNAPGVNYVLTGMIGLNFVIEMAVNIVLSPGILRIITLGKKK